MKKVIISFILGIVLSGTVVYAYVFYAQDISYDNTNSNISADNVQDAIDELYDMVTYGDATASDILNGKTALVNGEQVIGTLEINVSIIPYQKIVLTKGTNAYKYSLSIYDSSNNLIFSKEYSCNIYGRFDLVEDTYENNGVEYVISAKSKYDNSYGGFEGTIKLNNKNIYQFDAVPSNNGSYNINKTFNMNQRIIVGNDIYEINTN